MPAVKLRKRVSPTNPFNKALQQINGLYVHSSPPKGKGFLIFSGWKISSTVMRHYVRVVFFLLVGKGDFFFHL